MTTAMARPNTRNRSEKGIVYSSLLSCRRCLRKWLLLLLALTLMPANTNMATVFYSFVYVWVFFWLNDNADVRHVGFVFSTFFMGTEMCSLCDNIFPLKIIRFSFTHFIFVRRLSFAYVACFSGASFPVVRFICYFHLFCLLSARFFLFSFYFRSVWRFGKWMRVAKFYTWQPSQTYYIYGRNVLYASESFSLRFTSSFALLFVSCLFSVASHLLTIKMSVQQMHARTECRIDDSASFIFR